MKIAFVTTYEIKSQASGVRRQAESWFSLLAQAGHSVEYLNPWHHVDWRSYDVIHVFGGGAWMTAWIGNARAERLCVVHSPMLDVTKNKLLYRLVSRLPTFGGRLWCYPSIHRFNNRLSTLCLARSSDEADLLTKSLDVSPNRTALVPVSIEVSNTESRLVKLDGIQANEYCLHVSQYTQARKNVRRLAKACAIVGMPLIICGRPCGEAEKEHLIKDMPRGLRYQILDYVSKPELNWLFSNAKIFALPSIYEGVGLASLEAAYHGLEVVISSRGGARDYFKDMGHYCDPHDLNSICRALRRALHGSNQPLLSSHVRENYTEQAVVAKLVQSYRLATELCRAS